MNKIIARLSVLFLVIGAFVYYISRNIGTIKRTVNVTLSQSLGYVLLAVAFAVIGFFLIIVAHQIVFRALGIKRNKMEMLSLQTRSLAMNVLVPSGGVSVGVVFASDAKSRGESEAAAITGVILALLVDYASIAAILIIAILYLLSIGTLGLNVAIPAFLFFALSLGVFLLIYYAGKKRVVLKKFLDWVKNLANSAALTFRHKPIIKNETLVDRFMDELENAYRVMTGDREVLYKALGYMLLSHLAYLISIYILFLSLGIYPIYRVLLAGYAIGLMVVVISPTPNGVGLAEGSMTLAYGSMGISGAAAATVTLIYRGFYFWGPLFIGFFALQRKHLLGLANKSK